MVRHGAKLIIVDYLQLIGGQQRGANRVEFVGTLSRGLKELAKELDIPIIALSQLNRGTEYGGDKEPKLHHLRESGSIEQDADSVVFVYRPDMVEEPEDAQIIVAANRHGENSKMQYRFIGPYGKFTEWGDK